MQRHDMRVIFASEYPGVQYFLRGVVEQEDGVIVGQAENATRALTLARTLRPDVALVDCYLPHTAGLDSVALSRIGELLNTYNEMFHPAIKRSNSGGTRTNWYARKKVLEGYDAKIEAALPTIFEKEGYVTASLVQQYAGIDESEAVKRLKSLSRKYKWKTKQDPQKPEVIRYSPARATKSSGDQSPAA